MSVDSFLTASSATQGYVDIKQGVETCLNNLGITLKSLIGSGSEGSVYQAGSNEESNDLAVKVLSRCGDKYTTETTRGECLNPDRRITIVYSPSFDEFSSIGGETPGLASTTSSSLTSSPSPETPLVAIVIPYYKENLQNSLIQPGLQLDQKNVVSILRLTAEKVSNLLAQGIVHRDLKPLNLYIMRNEKGGIADMVIGDFGIARNFQEAPVTPLAPCSPVGTPGYCSPEIAALQNGGTGEVQSSFSPSVFENPGKQDVWSLGIILFQLLSGQAPYSGFLPKISPESLRLQQQLQDTPEYVHGMMDLLRGMLQKDPSQRFSIDQVIERLTQLQKDLEKKDQASSRWSPCNII